MAREDTVRPGTGSLQHGHHNPLWHIPLPSSLLWEEWETEYAIFNRNSGETHLINELPAQILRLLIKQPDHTSGLTEKLADLCEVKNDASWQQQTSGIIHNLASLGLIEVKHP